MLASFGSPRRAANVVPVSACLLAVVVALSACGSDKKSSSSGSSTGSGSATAAKDTTVPKKTIVYAQLVGDASEIAARESKAVKLATDALGWDMKYIQGAGDIPKMIQGISGAVNAGGDAVLIASTDAPIVKQAIDVAKRKKVPVIGVGGGAEPSTDYDAQYQESEQKMSEELTKQMVTDLGSKGTVAVVDNTQISAGKFRQTARENLLKGTTIKTVGRQEVDLADLIGGSKKAVAAMLTKNPKVDALWLVYDAMMPPGLEALNQRKNSTTKVYSYFANPSNVETMRKNKNVQALVDSNLDHTDLVALDQLARFFKDGTALDPAALKNCEIQYAVVTQDSLPPAGTIHFPVEDDAQPFIDNWKAGKYGEGAGCA
jgi:ABC-type sugar transport system substrate-binding protein